MASNTATRHREEQLPAVKDEIDPAVIDLGEDAGAGLEDLSMEEQLTPFLRILQKGSPQVDPAAAEYIEALRPGMIYNTATQEAYPGKEGIETIVCARDYHYGAWIPRDQGGGFRGMIRPDDPTVRRLVAQHGRFKALPHVINGEAVELVETIQLYVLYNEPAVTAENAMRAIVSFASTGLPVAQAYLTRHNAWRYNQRPAPIWCYRWRFSLVPQQNASGSWFNWKIDLSPPGAKPIEALIRKDDPLYALGKEFYELHKSGQVKADYDEAGATESGDDIPY